MGFQELGPDSLLEENVLLLERVTKLSSSEIPWRQRVNAAGNGPARAKCHVARVANIQLSEPRDGNVNGVGARLGKQAVLRKNRDAR